MILACKTVYYSCLAWLQDFQEIMQVSACKILARSCMIVATSLAICKIFEQAYKIFWQDVSDFAASQPASFLQEPYVWDDSEDIKRATLEMCKKANIVLSTFSSCDPQVKTILFSSHCLSLYGGALWDISCSQLNSLEVAFNNILRRIWKLPKNCHTRILHKVAHLESLFNRVLHLTDQFSEKGLKSNSSLISESFMLFYNNVFTPTGSNRYCDRGKYVKFYYQEDLVRVDFVRRLRINNSFRDPDTESMIITICCN